MSAQLIEVAAGVPRPGHHVLVLVEFPGNGTPVRSWMVDWQSTHPRRRGRWANLSELLDKSPQAAGARVTHWCELVEPDAMISADVLLPPTGTYVLTNCECAIATRRDWDGYMIDRWVGGAQPFEVLAKFKSANPAHWGAWRVARWADLPRQPLMVLH